MSTIKILDADSVSKYYNIIGTGTIADPYQPIVPDYRIAQAINIVFNDFGDTISVYEKAKSLVKFGTNPLINAGIAESVWSTGGDETYQTSNTINSVVSTSIADTQSVVIEGHTLSGGNFTFVSQTATLNGTTPVVLTTPLARANRLYNNGSTDFAGDVTVYVSGGTTHLTASGSDNQSLKCATTISSQDYWIITQVDIAVNRSNIANVDFKMQVREYGKVFRTQYFTTSGNGSNIFTFDQPIIVRPNSDVRVQAISNANTTSVSASIHGYIAIIQ